MPMKQNFSLFLEISSSFGSQSKLLIKNEGEKKNLIQEISHFCDSHSQSLTPLIGKEFRSYFISYTPVGAKCVKLESEGENFYSTEEGPSHTFESERWFLFFFGHFSKIKRGQDLSLQNYFQKHFQKSFSDWKFISQTDVAKKVGMNPQRRIHTVRGGLSLLHNCVLRESYRLHGGLLEKEDKLYGKVRWLNKKTAQCITIDGIYGDGEELENFYEQCLQNKPINTEALWKLPERVAQLEVCGSDWKTEQNFQEKSSFHRIYKSLRKETSLRIQLVAAPNPLF